MGCFMAFCEHSQTLYNREILGEKTYAMNRMYRMYNLRTNCYTNKYLNWYSSNDKNVNDKNCKTEWIYSSLEVNVISTHRHSCFHPQ